VIGLWIVTTILTLGTIIQVAASFQSIRASLVSGTKPNQRLLGITAGMIVLSGILAYYTISNTPNSVSTQPYNPPQRTSPAATSTATSIPTLTPTAIPTYLMAIGVADGDTPGYGLAIINGTQYPHSLRYQFPYSCCSMSFTSTFNLDQRFRRFQATIGMEDNAFCSVAAAPATCKVEYELYGDNIRIYDKTVAVTDTSFKVDLDIQNVGTLTIKMTSIGNFFAFKGTAAWGDAIVSNT